MPELLSRKPIVYSFGVGWDVSFDLALIDEFNAEVFAFDPTPKSIEWAEHNVHNSHFHLYRYGISDTDGSTKFYLPKNEKYVSCTASEESTNGSEKFIIVLMKRFASITKELGHEYIDLLKMDIEGTEFQVMPDVLRSGVRIGQLCIEVHNRFYSDGSKRLKALISTLNDAGYYIVSVSPSYEELTFIRR